MKSAFLAIFLLIALAATAQSSGDSSTQLPAAPSAVKMQQQAPPPAAKQQQPQPAQDSTAPESSPSDADPLLPPPDAPAEKAPAKKAAESSSGSSASDSGDAAARPVNENPATTIIRRVDEVNVVFTVTDKHGHFIKDLKQDDFKFLDDHMPVETIRHFSSLTNLPLRVGLLIDASNSIRERFRFEQEAAIEFLNQIIKYRTDKAFVIGFDTTAEVTQDMTSNVEDLSHGVRMMRPGGGTALYDAIFFACRDKLLKEKDSTPVRKAIILLSDGDDNQSRVTREEAIDMAQRAEVVIYAISTNVAPNKDRGDKVLERIAEATGGRTFFPFKIEDVANAFSDIKDELRSQYAVAYKPADFIADGRFRSIDIEPIKGKYHVRSRKGYYAPKK